MNKNIYCGPCELEFRIKHDADDDIFVPEFCPFCGANLDLEEEYDVDDVEEDEE